MTNSWQNQQEDTGLQMDCLSPEQKVVHDIRAKENVKEKKKISFTATQQKNNWFAFPVDVSLELASMIKVALEKRKHLTQDFPGN